MSSPISGFTAIPNPQMLAFMPIQSYLMMYFAGSAWQFGKRKISAMSNEEFNKLTMKTLLEEHTIELKSVIPTLERSLNDITPLIRVLIEQYGDFIKEALAAIPQAILNSLGQTGGDFANIPTSSGGSGLGSAQTASMLHYFKQLADATKISDTSFSSKSTGTSDFGTEKARVGQRITGREAPTNLIPYQGKWVSLTMMQNLIKAQASASDRKEIRGLTPQLSIFEQNRTEKRKAGQSQKLEKAKLIQKIKSMTLQLPHSSNTDSFEQLQRNINKKKQSLANLLGRYRF